MIRIAGRATLLMMSCLLTSCSDGANRGELRREVIQGFSATFYEVTDGTRRWREISISVDGSKTFRMPAFFTRGGAIVDLDDAEAHEILDQWLKKRAEQVAAYGMFDPRLGQQGPFLPIEQIVR